MLFAIIMAPQAVQDFKRLKAHRRAEVRDALEAHLRHGPTKTSRSRIKRLRGLLSAETVEVLAIVPKSEADAWLTQFGSPE